MADSKKDVAEKPTPKRKRADQLMSMWAASLVVAFLFVILFGVQVFYVQEESTIRRESYIANLQQLYQQETQECFGLAAGAAEGEGAPQSSESAQQCLERVNEEGRYAQLLRKWSGDELLLDTLEL